MAVNEQKQIWIEKARQGDWLALVGLLTAHYPLLRSRAEARMDQALKAKLDPEDILQEVYLDVFRLIDRFEDRGPDAFLNWVLTILDSNLVNARRALRRQKRDVAREVPLGAPGGTTSYRNLLDELCTASGTPSRAVRHEEEIGALLASIAELPDQHQQVVRLRFLNGHRCRRGREPARQVPWHGCGPDPAGPRCATQVDGASG